MEHNTPKLKGSIRKQALQAINSLETYLDQMDETKGNWCITWKGALVILERFVDAMTKKEDLPNKVEEMQELSKDSVLEALKKKIKQRNDIIN